MQSGFYCQRRWKLDKPFISYSFFCEIRVFVGGHVGFEIALFEHAGDKLNLKVNFGGNRSRCSEVIQVS